MKHLITLVCTVFFVLAPFFSTQAAGDGITEDFQNKLEERLQNEVNYYNKGSFEIDQALTMDGQIIKLISADDPKTEENEEKTEEYQSNFTIALVKYEQKRDSIFYFDNYDLFYYDNDKQEFLILSNIVQNKEAEAFFTEQISSVQKEVQPLSLILAIAMISLILIVPILIVIFHNKSNSTIPPTIKKQTTITS
jgi:hypothetical protein